MTMLTFPCVTVAVVLLLCAGALDLLFRTIPNWLSCALACDGAVLGAAHGAPGSAALAGVVVFVSCAILWRFGLMGGGDVKLFGAAATVVPACGTFVAATALAGGLLALAYAGLRLALRRRPPRAGRPSGRVGRMLRIERRRVASGSLPYGCAIAAGAFLALAGA